PNKQPDPANRTPHRGERPPLPLKPPPPPKPYPTRLWSVFFGKGLANPIDDFSEQTQVAHPELLAKLAEKFKHYSYDSKKLIRWLCNSEAYNISVVANKTNDKQEHEVLFSRMLMEALSPQQPF